MQFLRYLVFGVVFLLQGCRDIPIFSNDDPVNENDAVVVFSFYQKFFLEASFFHKEHYIYRYFRTGWTGKSQLLGTSIANHLSSNNVQQKYVVAKLKPGKYFLSSFSTTYSDGNYRYTIDSPLYTSEFHPLFFSVKAGEVKYLGDIEFKSVDASTSGSRLIPVYTIHDNFKDAKVLMEKRYPAYSQKISKGTLTKTSEQVLIEQQYQQANNQGLLKDLKHAK